MIRKIIFFCWLITIGGIAYCQCPTTNFSTPISACLNEQLYPDNLTIGANSNNWDFCSGDFELTPTIESIGSSPSIGRGRSFRVANLSNGDWVGFTIDQASNRLVIFEFGNSPQNIPIITNLGNPEGILARAYDFDIIQESGQWYMLVINSTTNELIRFAFGTDLLNDTPTISNLGDFSELDTPNNLTLVNELGNLLVFISNGGNGSITRLDFGGSILNFPVAASFSVTGINNPRGIDIIKDCDRWVGLVTSYSGNKVFYLDFDNGLSQAPTTGEITFFTSYNFPAALKIIHEGGEYYGLIQSALGDLYKLSFGTSITDFNGNGQNLGDFGLSNNFATEWINDDSDWYGFSIELDNPSTPGAGNLIRYTFPTTCEANPSVSSISNPQFEYTTSGNHQVTLLARNTTDDITSFNKSITISSSPAPQISTQITGNCLTNPISFAGEQLSVNITSWNWDFGDGSGTSTSQNDTYTYSSAGTYQVKLSVTDANGCTNLYIDTARVYEEPIPDFTAPLGTLCMNNAIAFTNTSTGETGSMVSWTWDFNGEGTSTEKEPDFTFLTSGSKTITLTSSLPGCANVTQQTIFIEEAPTTSFSFNNTCNSQTTVFTDLTTGSNLTAWNWDFGDSSNSTDQSPVHSYALPGKYVVTLAVSNNLGCTTTKVDTVYNGAIPVVSFINDLPCSTSPIQFTDQSTVQDANLIAWEWDFGDGNFSADQNPFHTYNQTGDFAVQLKTFSQLGCVDSTESIITILQGPEVDFDWDKGCEGEATSFTDSTNSFGQPITNWTWLIDGQLFTDPNPVYIFPRSDSFNIQLGVTINNLCSQSVTKEIIIESSPPTSFGYAESCTSDSTLFFDTTPNTISSWQWRINGAPVGNDSTLSTNLAPNNYNISLTTISASGCTNDKLLDIDITGSLTAQYSASTNYGAAPLTVKFSNQSTGTNSYLWLFDDSSNSLSTEIDPQFEFTELGSYTVTLIALGGLNCSDTTIQIIEVVEPINELSIDAITSLENGNIAISMTNLGSITYDENNLQLIFNIDDGADIIEAFTINLYPKTTINYVPSIRLGETGNSKILCVELKYIDAGLPEILDANCLNLNNESVISSAYPNPTSKELKFSTVLPKAGSVNIILVDSNGAIVLSSIEEGSKGLNEYVIDLTPFRSGLYILIIEAGSIREEMKVIIDK